MLDQKSVRTFCIAAARRQAAQTGIALRPVARLLAELALMGVCSGNGRSCVCGGLPTATSGGSGRETRAIGSRRSPRSPDRICGRRLSQETEPNSVSHGLGRCRRSMRDCLDVRR